MQLKKLTLKNFKQFRNFELDFVSPNSDKILLITGENASGKTTVVDGIKWCLYRSKAKHTTILNQDITEFPVTVSAELIFQEKGISYKSITSQIYTSKTYCERINTKLYRYDSTWIEIPSLEIYDLIPQYISDFIFYSPEQGHEIIHTTSTLITNFINEIRHRGTYDIKENTFVETFNKNIGEFFNAISNKKTLTPYIDNHFNLCVMDGPSGAFTLPGIEQNLIAFAISSTLVKMFFEYKNSNGFIVTDGVLSFFDLCIRERFLQELKNLSFEQILILASNRVEYADGVNKMPLNNTHYCNA